MRDIFHDDIGRMAGSRVRLAFERVLRAGGVAPPTRMNSDACTDRASQMSFRLSACDVWPSINACTWLVAENPRASIVCARASTGIIPVSALPAARATAYGKPVNHHLIYSQPRRFTHETT